MPPKKNILVIHGYCSYPLRASVRDLLYCFEKYVDDSNCFYLNLHSGFTLPRYIHLVKWDLIIYHTTFLSGKWLGKPHFEKYILGNAKRLAKINCPKVMSPQDEWIHCNSLVKFINETDITRVFTVSLKEDWPKIYHGVDFNKVKFHTVLTGYIDDGVLTKIMKLENDGVKRNIDIGYRAFQSPPWLGKSGHLKTEIATVFQKNTPKYNYQIDISTNSNDTITGDKWYEFMLSCKYFIGVEGGSTVIDRDGEIWKRGTEYLEKNPDADFGEIEEHVFKGLDGTLNLLVISPRHLEACMTRTVQILVEGNYNGILMPGIHYIELKKDFSNIDIVLGTLRDEHARIKMADKAYEDIVLSGNYSYRHYANFIVKTSSNTSSGKAVDAIIFHINTLAEKAKWKQIRRISLGEKNTIEKMKDYYKFTFLPKLQGRIRRIAG